MYNKQNDLKGLNTMMSLYQEIVNEIEGFEESHTPISNIAHKKGFIMKEKQNNDEPFGYYECFHAEKEDGKYKIIITIETRDNYRSFGKDDEPYHNTVALYENDTCIASKNYTYFE